MMEYFYMSEIIGEKFDEEVVHPYAHICFTNKNLKTIFNRYCLYYNDSSGDLYAEPCRNDIPEQYYSLDSTT